MCFSFFSKQTDHPLVAEAAVVGFPHEVKGEGVYAYVILKARLHILGCITRPSRWQINVFVINIVMIGLEINLATSHKLITIETCHK